MRPPPIRRTPSSLDIAKMLSGRRMLRHTLPSIPVLSFWLRNARQSRTFSILKWTTLSSPLLLFLSNNSFQVMWISGRSMAPFLNTDFNKTLRRDAVLVSLWLPGHDLHRGDVVAFYTPHDPERMAVKRVIALQGDEIRMKRKKPKPKSGADPRRREAGKETLNDEAAAETQAKEPQIVPQGHIWVEGDNPESRFTYDSNNFGPIAVNTVVGKVVAGVWPRFSWVSWKDWGGCDRVRMDVMEYDKQPMKR